MHIGMIAVLWWLALTGLAGAEPFADVYGGWSMGRSTDVSAVQRTCFLVGCTTTVQTTQHQAFESGAAAGVRGGYWFERHPWLGMAGDLSYTRTASDHVHLDAWSIAATPMLRLPLWKTPDRPRGLLQPYISGGPTIVVHQVWSDFRPSAPVTMNGWSLGVGWTARAGLAILLTRHVALFGEWRLSQERVSLRDTGFFGLGDLGRLDFTHTAKQVIVGGSYRF